MTAKDGHVTLWREDITARSSELSSARGFRKATGLEVKPTNGAHFFLEGPLTGGGCWEGPPFSTELPRRQLCSPAAGEEEESEREASQTTGKP